MSGTPTLGLDLSGGLDLTIDPLQITTGSSIALTGDPKQPVSIRIEPLQITLTPITTDSSIHLEFSNFPKLDFNQLMTLVKRIFTPDRRVTLPVNLNFAVSVFPLTLWGVDAVSFKVCGETMLIREDYVPNKFERGEDCGDPCDEIKPC